jgi:VWA domain containing CoxE-like protein
MNILSHRPRSKQAAAIRDRIFNVLPAASYQMEKLFGLLDIDFSETIPTACVECSVTPRLLLNPRFIEEYCISDNDLFLLILHELHHVILGHTRLFPRGTVIDNIAFDAVINSMLAQTVGLSVGVNLFTSTNPFESFPSRLLRPPPGWPGPFWDAIAHLPGNQSKVIKLLYGPDDGTLTYHDIYEVLRTSLKTHDVEGFVLLGNHQEESQENPFVNNVVRGIVEGWPPPPLRISGRDQGVKASEFYLNGPQEPGAAFRKAFREVLRKCGIHSGRGPAVYRPRMTLSERLIETVLPDGRDRRVTALRAITGGSPLIYRSTVEERRLRPARVPVVHLYLDVSGSMEECLPSLTAVCREPFRRGELKIFAFSTVVSEVKGTDLSRIPILNTGGTEIDPVLRHLTEIPHAKRPKVVLLATDGYVGRASTALIRQLGKIRFVAALTDPAYHDDLRPWVHERITLPKP